jgi:hypothetical protein
MSELYSSDPYITWAAVWVASRETGLCKACRRRRLIVWAVRGLAVAAVAAEYVFILATMGVVR